MRLNVEMNSFTFANARKIFLELAIIDYSA